MNLKVQTKNRCNVDITNETAYLLLGGKGKSMRLLFLGCRI